MTCANCGKPFYSDLDGMTLHHQSVIVVICEDCLSGTLMVKISVRRPTVNKPFEYDQFSAPEVERKSASKR